MFLLSVLALLQFFYTPQAPTIKIRAEYVKVPVTVFDAQGKLLPGLRREQFQLLDEDEPRPIENFILDKTPLHLILLLDVSGSTREELDQFREAAYQFARSFGREDRIAVMTFAERVTVVQNWTNKLGDIRHSLNKLEKGYRTALYDALQSVSLKDLARVQGKKVIIVLTDGLDNESETTYDTLVETLIESQVSLYIVSRTRLVQDRIGKSERVEFLNEVMKNVLDEKEDFVSLYFRQKEEAINNLAEATGGRVFFPEKLEELGSSYAELVQELKGQYLLTFEPPPHSEKRWRRIRVICTEPTGRIHHRSQYAWDPPE